jgi:hypothetical protein
MKHIVERILDGLPVFIQEDFPRFVELLRAYYTWQSAPDKAIGILYGHDSLIDIDRDGLVRSIEELDETAVPPKFRRAWKLFAQQFNASRGSIQSWHDFFSIFYNESVAITDGSQFVFQPSAARVERYKRCIINTTQSIPRSAVLLQSISNASADIVEASLIARRGVDRYYEVTVKPRTRGFFPGSVKIVTPTGIVDGEFCCFQRFKPTAGQLYQLGDRASVSTALVTTRGVVASLSPAVIVSLGVVTGGTLYRQGDIISLPGCRGFRGEVAKVSAGGAILTARIINRGDPFGGHPTFSIDTLSGSGATLSFVGDAGKPSSISFSEPIWGDVIDFTIVSDAGTGISVTWEPYVFDDVAVKTGFNGVVGIGTRLTDSAAWMDSSYTVTTSLGRAEWKEFATAMLHQPGRHMNTVKSVRQSVIVSAAIIAESQLSTFAPLSVAMSTGEQATAGLVAI